MEEVLRGARADPEKLGNGNARERRTRIRLDFGAKITPNEARVGLTDLDERLARAMMRYPHHVEALVGLSVSKNRYVQHGLRPLSQFIAGRQAATRCADARSNLRLVLGSSLTVVATGAAVGVLGAGSLSRRLEVQLYAVRPTDPMTLVLVTAGVVALRESLDLRPTG